MNNENELTIFEWIETELKPASCNSEEFFYNEMESQSDYSLPILYQPFDPGNPSHWLDRGAILDFLHATGGPGKTLLDFGPGDGWPALLVAPQAKAVTGVDGSSKRVEVCTANAARLGITNARFLLVEPGTPLPFPDHTFDGATAASSIEQTPDPRATLAEIFRVLRPGGRLRVYYEALEIYRNGQEQDANLEARGENLCLLTIYDRHIDEETATMYRLSLAMPVERALQVLQPDDEQPLFQGIGLAALENLRENIRQAKRCKLNHPSGRTLARWMKEIGFTEVSPTHWGGRLALQLFHQLDEQDRPEDLQAVDKLLDPLVRVAVILEAPWVLSQGHSPLITAVK